MKENKKWKIIMVANKKYPGRKKNNYSKDIIIGCNEWMKEGSLIMERFSRKKNVNKALKQIQKLRTNKKLKGTKKS